MPAPCCELDAVPAGDSAVLPRGAPRQGHGAEGSLLVLTSSHRLLQDPCAQEKLSCGVSVLCQPREQNWLSPPGLDPFRLAFREFSLRQTLRTNMRKTEVRKMMKTQGSTMEFTERNRRALRSAFSLKSAANAPMYARICEKNEEKGKN